jgi:hypothetical protein
VRAGNRAIAPANRTAASTAAGPGGVRSTRLRVPHRTGGATRAVVPVSRRITYGSGPGSYLRRKFHRTCHERSSAPAHQRSLAVLLPMRVLLRKSV